MLDRVKFSVETRSVPTMYEPDPEIRAEREYMAACSATLTRMREEVSTMLATGAGEGDAFLDKYFNHVLRQFRIQTIEELSDVEGAPLFFGRLEYPPGEIYDGVRKSGSVTHEPDRDLVYVGRRGVRDDDGE